MLCHNCLYKCNCKLVYLIFSWVCLQIKGIISIILRGILTVPGSPAFWDTPIYMCITIVYLKKYKFCMLWVIIIIYMRMWMFICIHALWYMYHVPILLLPLDAIGWESRLLTPRKFNMVSRQLTSILLIFWLFRLHFPWNFPHIPLLAMIDVPWQTFDSVLRFLLSSSRILAPHAVGTPTTTSFLRPRGTNMNGPNVTGHSFLSIKTHIHYIRHI